MIEIPFKFKYVNEAGEQEGFRSKKGLLTQDYLVLDDAEVSVFAVVKTYRRFDRLVLEILQQDESIATVVLAITKGNLKEICSALNTISSAQWAKARKDALIEEGEAHRFRMEQCPHCRSAVDLTDIPSTAQVFCTFCETIFTRGDDNTDGEKFKLCDECGFFSSPVEYTSFYFYFLLIFYGFNSQKHYDCHSCMRKRAWKMFFANLIFILGVPFAIIQLVRSHTGGASFNHRFAGLDKANKRAEKGNFMGAMQLYKEILDREQHAAGIHFNMGLMFFARERTDAAIEHFQNSIKSCGNFDPAIHHLLASYQAEGMTNQIEAFRNAYHMDE